MQRPVIKVTKRMNTRESTIASDRICGAASKQTSELL